MNKKNLIQKGGMLMVIAIISMAIGIPGALWAIIQIVNYLKNKDRHNSSNVH